jgi:hypothetical protein
MTDPSGYAKTLALPAGFDAPRLLRYDDVTAHAITRDDLGADVRGINASLDLLRETRGGTWPTGPVTEEEGLRRPKEFVRLPAAAPALVDPTGCGDAFCGGFLVGLAETGDLRTAMACGTVAAGTVAQDHGAAHALTVDRDDVRRRLRALGPLAPRSATA